MDGGPLRCLICRAEIEEGARVCPACGSLQSKFAAPEDGSDELIGELVGNRFEVKELLGVGGMGKVFLASDSKTGQDVVLKVLHDYLASETKLVLRFGREWRALRRISHPNIVQVIDFSLQEGGTCYMAMEYIDGVDLTALLTSRARPTEEHITRIGIQVCRALDAAHSSKVIHRDLKPENVMITRLYGMDDFVKVLDFGIAKIQDPDDATGVTLTMAGEAFGTFEYMSPEQTMGVKGRDLDGRSDIYQLGVMLYELLTRTLPFTSENPLEILQMIREQPLDPPRDRAPEAGISEGMERVVMKALAKDKRYRFASAKEMESALSALLPPASVPPLPPPDAFEAVRATAGRPGLNGSGTGTRGPGNLLQYGKRAAGKVGSWLLSSRLRIATVAAGVAILLSALLLWSLPLGRYRQVREALEEGKPSVALKLLADIPASNDPRWFVLKAKAYLAVRQPRYRKAERLLKRALKISDGGILEDEEAVRALVNLLAGPGAHSSMRLLERLGKKDLLIEILEQAARGEGFRKRWNSIEVLRRMGEDVSNRLQEAYSLDALGDATCSRQRSALKKLKAIAPDAAAGVIEELLRRPVGKRGCLTDTRELRTMLRNIDD